MSVWVPSRSPRERDKVEYVCCEMTAISRTPEPLSKQVCLLDDVGCSPYFPATKGSKKVDATEYREQLKTRCDAADDSSWTSPCAPVVPTTGKAEDGCVLLGIDYNGYGGVVKRLPEELGYGGCSPPPKDAFINVSSCPLSTADDECCAIRIADACGLGADECDGGVGFTAQGENRCAATAVLPEPPAADAIATSYHQAADEPECGSAWHLPVMLEAMEDLGFPEAETATPVSNPQSPVGQPMQCSDDGTDETFLPASDELTPVKAPPVHTFAHRFLHVKFLGKGQFGEAYVVRRPSCSPQEEEEEEVLKIILNKKYRIEEYELPWKFPHENVVRMLRKEHIGLHVCLFQEYVKGQALEELWAENTLRGRTLNDADMDVLGYQMLDALRHLDNHSIVHRDIKPSNIIRGYSSGRGTLYKLIDFGLSEQLMDEERVRCVKGFRGSYAYAAPECCRLCPLSKTCQDGYNTKADEWSLAITLVQMCSFQVPWHHYVRNCPALLNKLLTEPHLMQEYAGNEVLVRCSSWWRQVLVSMLSPCPALRPDVGELLDSMDRKQRESLPDFGLLSEDMAECTSIDADTTCECYEYKCNRLSLPDFEQLQE